MNLFQIWSSRGTDKIYRGLHSFFFFHTIPLTKRDVVCNEFHPFLCISPITFFSVQKWKLAMLVLFFCLNASCCIYKKRKRKWVDKSFNLEWQLQLFLASRHSLLLSMAKASFFLRQKSDNGIGLDQKNLTTMKKRQAELVLCLTTKFFMFVRQQVTFLLRSCTVSK